MDPLGTVSEQGSFGAASKRHEQERSLPRKPRVWGFRGFRVPGYLACFELRVQPSTTNPQKKVERERASFVEERTALTELEVGRFIRYLQRNSCKTFDRIRILRGSSPGFRGSGFRLKHPETPGILMRGVASGFFRNMGCPEELADAVFIMDFLP